MRHLTLLLAFLATSALSATAGTVFNGTTNNQPLQIGGVTTFVAPQTSQVIDPNVWIQSMAGIAVMTNGANVVAGYDSSGAVALLVTPAESSWWPEIAAGFGFGLLVYGWAWYRRIVTRVTDFTGGDASV
jgi:hypothetical protein